jgi:hypothetical protein
MFGRTKTEDKVAEDHSRTGRFGRPGATRGDADTVAMPADNRADWGDTDWERRDREPGTAATTTPPPPPPATEPVTTAPAVRSEHMRAMRAQQRAEFGGFSWGAAFFGWLVAFGMAALLTGIVAAAGAATGFTNGNDQQTIGLAGGIALLVCAAIAYYCGGYVAGRMSRFDGGRQGLGVWIVSILVTLALGVLGAALGSEYNVISRADLPRLTVGQDTATTAGIVAMAAILLVSLVAAMLGGKAGERWHRRVDRTVVDDV